MYRGRSRRLMKKQPTIRGWVSSQPTRRETLIIAWIAQSFG